MTKTEARSTIPEAPGGETAPKKRSVPNRKKRYSFFEDGNDHVLLAVEQGQDGKAVPNGALKPIPDTPRFRSATDAKRWVQASGAPLAGLTVMVVRMQHKLQVRTEENPLVRVYEDSRFERESEDSDSD